VIARRRETGHGTARACAGRAPHCHGSTSSHPRPCRAVRSPCTRYARRGSEGVVACARTSWAGGRTRRRGMPRRAPRAWRRRTGRRPRRRCRRRTGAGALRCSPARRGTTDDTDCEGVASERQAGRRSAAARYPSAQRVPDEQAAWAGTLQVAAQLPSSQRCWPAAHAGSGGHVASLTRVLNSVATQVPSQHIVAAPDTEELCATIHA
jgi:hypothetical protein